MKSKHNAFGELFKETRLKNLNKSLRQFCFDNGFDPGRISRIERGRVSPPKNRYLEKYALALNIKKDSDEWKNFFGVANICRDGIIANGEEDLYKKLPVFIRTATGKKLTLSQMQNLIEIIKTC